MVVGMKLWIYFAYVATELRLVKSYMNQNKTLKQTLESAQYGLEIIFKGLYRQIWSMWKK